MLLQNAIKIIGETPQWLQSRTESDTKVYRFGDGRFIEIKGGTEHLKRSGDAEIRHHYIDWSLYDTDEFEFIVERLLYTFNNMFKPLNEFSLTELKEILESLSTPVTETLTGRVVLFLINHKCQNTKSSLGG